MDEKRLGVVVQEARRAKGFMQQTLCQKSGLSYSTLAKIERGAIKSPSIFTIQTIAATLGVGLDFLMQSVPPAPSRGRRKVSRSGVRFVYFDMNGCLLRYYNQAFNKLSEDSGMSLDVIETVFWQYDEDVNRGVKTVEELNVALSEKCAMPVDWNAYYLAAVEATPGMDELVHWVAENYQLGILTNTMPNLVKPLLESGILPNVKYDAIVQSCNVEALKPEQRMFEIAAAETSVEPHEILLIDDDRPNLQAAGRMGWHTMNFDAHHPEESIVAISTALQPA